MKQGTNCYFENGKIILLNQKIKLNKKVQLITFILLRRLMNLKIKCNKLNPKEQLHNILDLWKKQRFRREKKENLVKKT